MTKHFLASLVLLSLWINPASAQPLKVGLLVPGSETHAFWNPLVNVAHAAAEDLDIQLTAQYASENTYSIRKVAEEFLDDSKNNRPDYLIAVYIEGVTDEIIRGALDRDLKVLLLNTDVPDSAVETIGRPRARYKNWIAHMMPNDVQAGALLADSLIQAALDAGHSKADIVGVNGIANTTVPEDRADGLKSKVQNNPKATLHNIADADWSPVTAASRTELMLQQHPETSVIWAASDTMALSAADIAQKAGLAPGEDVFIGGMDWSTEGIDAVTEGTLAATVGGHFMDGAWALVLIRDHHEGIDFEPELGAKVLTSMQAITKSNVDQYLNQFGDRNWSSIDFKKFSKTYNKQLDQYDFTLKTLLN